MAKKKNQQEATATAVAEQPAPDLAPQPDPAPVAPNLADLDIVGGLGGIATAPTSRRKTGPVPGVNPKALARAFVAGKVLAKHGHANGCPDELVAEVDAAYGKANAIESGICLRNGLCFWGWVLDPPTPAHLAPWIPGTPQAPRGTPKLPRREVGGKPRPTTPT
jgi:hypothetical protein